MTRPLQEGETPSSIARQGYDTSAQRYLEWSASIPSPRLEWLTKLFGVMGKDALLHARVLELGCGAGVPCTIELAKNVDRVVAVDISSAQIDLAQSRFHDAGLDDVVELVTADMLELAFEDGCFDAICAFYSVIHLDLAGQRTMLERCRRWLGHGGYLLLNLAATEERDEGGVNENWLGMRAYWASFGPEVLDVVKWAGFEIVESDTVQVVGDAAFVYVIARKVVAESSTSAK